MQKTRIICTAGPSVDSIAKITALAKNGMNIMRLNCSHGTTADRLRYLKFVRHAEMVIKKPLGVMIDLQGPRLRVGILPQPITLAPNENWLLTTNKARPGQKNTIPVELSGFGNEIRPGTNIYMDDGLLHTKVLKKVKNGLLVQVTRGGILSSRKGINIPFVKGKLNILNERDEADILWALRHDADFIALSFVRNSRDIQVVKKFITAHNKERHTPLIVAKIEKPEAIDNIQEIIRESDAIMVARGDLGIELGLKKVPIVQQTIINACREQKKPVIVATQMLSSMRQNPIPTRAEVSDVANAIFAGADGVLLTGETSAGSYPIEATQTVRDIVLEIETSTLKENKHKSYKLTGEDSVDDAIVYHALKIAEDINAKAFLVMTYRGILTRILSKLEPVIPTYSLAVNKNMERATTLYRGIQPLISEQKHWLIRLKQALHTIKKELRMKKDDTIVTIDRDSEGNVLVKVIAV